MKRLLSSLALTTLVVCLAGAQPYNTPLQHVIVIVQENRTPTNLFGNDAPLIASGAHITKTGFCGTQAIDLTQYSYQLDACFNPDHWHASWKNSYDKGKMDGACTIGNGATKCTQFNGIPNCTVNGSSVLCPQYTYVANTPVPTGNLLDPYFTLAAQYGFANYMFQTNQGPSFPAHQFLLAGTSEPIFPPTQFYDWFVAENGGGAGGCISKAGAAASQIDPTGKEGKGYTPLDPAGANVNFPCYDHNTLVDVLGAPGNHITWRYYGGPGDQLWLAPKAVDRICKPSAVGGTCTGSAWTNVTTSQGQILHDLGVTGNGIQGSCNLQQVSWVTPDGHWSDHPGAVGHDGGPSWVAAIVNAVGGYDNQGGKLPITCNYWANTAILVVWDDWGGFYDDVDPIKYMGQGYPNGGGNGLQYVYGFRVPLLVISPYTPMGYISGGGVYPPACSTGHYCHDFGSILNFIEYAFGTGGSPLSEIGYAGLNWHYADYYAQDKGPAPNNYSLYDFFNFSGQPRTYTPITKGVKYQDNCFFKPSLAGCFVNFRPAPADDDYAEKD